MSSKTNSSDPSKLSLTERLIYFLGQSEAIARQAKRGKKSLSGDSSYAESFHSLKTQTIRTLREIQSLLIPYTNPALERTLSDVDKELAYFFDPRYPELERRDLRRHINMLVGTEIEPALISPRRQEVEYVPLEIVEGSRGYVESVARQANRCFQYECYDACGVMLRRLLEMLIIEVFEKKGLAASIKDRYENYLMFTDLVNKLINTTATPVGRTVRKGLPTTAVILNNCAHSRAFNIGKAQLVQNQAVIVIAVQELMSLWDIQNP